MGWCGAGVHRSRRLHRLHHRGLRAQLLRILHTDHSSHTSGRRSAIPAFRPVREPHPSNTSATPHPSNGAPRHPFSALDLPELLVAFFVRFWLAVFVFFKSRWRLCCGQILGCVVFRGCYTRCCDVVLPDNRQVGPESRPHHRPSLFHLGRCNPVAGCIRIHSTSLFRVCPSLTTPIPAPRSSRCLAVALRCFLGHALTRPFCQRPFSFFPLSVRSLWLRVLQRPFRRY